MKGQERLLYLLSEVDAALVEEAARPQPAKKPVIRWKRWAALAACLLLVLAAPRLMPKMGSTSDESNSAALPPEFSENTGAADGSGTGPGEPEANPGEGELPQLTVIGQFSEGCGGYGVWTGDVEGYLSYGADLSAGTDRLPVYRAASSWEGTEDGDRQAMYELLDDILLRFGLSREDCVVKEQTGGLTAETPDGARVEVEISLTARVILPEEGVSDAIRLADCTTYAGAEIFARAVMAELGWLLNMTQPTAHITGGDVNLYGTAFYQVAIFDGPYTPLDPTQSSVCVACYGLEGGGQPAGILALTINDGRRLEYMGSYPTITPDEAVEQLLAGCWTEEIPTEEQILRMELVYCTDVGGLVMPCYRVYLDLGKQVDLVNESTGIPTGESVPWIVLGYVPCVDSRYLDISGWTGPVGNS